MGKSSKAKEAELRRQYQEARRREELEKQRRQNRLMWQIVIGVLAGILIVTLIAVAISIGSRRTAPAMDDLDFSTVQLENCIDTTEVTEHVRLNVTYTDKDGETQTGDIVIRLYEKVAPTTVKNFQKLVEDGFYDGLTFHRISSGFMIQGGDPDGDGTGGSTPITGEMTNNGFVNNLKHVRGVVSMARLGGDYDSASCQFFIMHADNADLNNEYASFGYVVYGMDTVDGIAGTEVRANERGEMSVPINPVIINSATFVTIHE